MTPKRRLALELAMPDDKKTTNGRSCKAAELMEQLLLDKSEVASLLRVNENAVSHLHRCRQLRGVLVGKNLRWKPTTVRQYVDGLNPDD